MKRMTASAVLVLVGLLGMQTALADSNVGVALKVGTLGFGADLAVGINDHVGLRVGGNFGTLEQKVDLDEATVNGEAQFQTIPLLLDLFPFGGGFRVSFGAMVNNNKITLSAIPNEPLKVNGNYYIIDRLEGDITFTPWSPYAGIGYGSAAAEGGHVRFSCDFGVMFHGSPQAEARAYASDSWLQTRLQSDLDEDVEQFENDVKSLSIYPVFSVGVLFTF